MSELFDEVDEDVRRDQLKKLWDKYSVYIVAAALFVVAGVGGWRGYQYIEAKKAAGYYAPEPPKPQDLTDTVGRDLNKY